MIRPEIESKTNRILLVTLVAAMLWLAGCSPTDAQSKIDNSPSLNTQIQTCIYQNDVPPTSSEPVCLPNSPHLPGVNVTLVDKVGNNLLLQTNQNGQIVPDEYDGKSYISSEKYPQWSINYAEPVNGYCLAYPVIIEDQSLPNWVEYQFAYLPCP